MKIEYQISKEDYVEGFKLASFYGKVKQAVFLGLMLVMIAYTLWSGQYGFSLAIMALGFILFALRTWLYPSLIAKSYDNYPSIQETMSVELEDKGVRFITTKVNSLVTWNEIVKWKANADYILVYQSQSIYQIIPTRLKEQKLDIDKLLFQLDEFVGPKS